MQRPTHTALPGLDTLEVYQLLGRPSGKNYRRVLRLIDSLTPQEVRQKEAVTGNTLMHLVVIHLVDLAEVNEDNVSPAVPVLYRLALRGCDVNAQNEIGNTALHLACFRPFGEKVMQHLIRLGADTSLMNEAGCRVIHDNAQHFCWLVKGQASAKCSLWTAVQREDTEQIDMYMQSWCRVATRRKRKTLIDVAYDTGNYSIVDRIQRYHNTNELVIAALACHLETVRDLLKLKSDKCDLRTHDHSRDIPKPLIGELKEYLPFTKDVINLLLKYDVASDEAYLERMNHIKNEFFESEFFPLVETMTVESLEKAWHVVNSKGVNVNASREEDGASYLHFLVDKYLGTEKLVLKRLLLRLMYKLCLEGINTQKRNCRGETALVVAYRHPPDRILLDHLLQMGVDSSIRTYEGFCVSVNTYATRGELLLSHEHSRAYMPGLWVAVEDGDLERVKFWLANLCRVNCSKSGRTMLQLAKDLGYTDIVAALESALHLTEFVVATLAGDLGKMKHHLAMGNGAKKVNACYQHYFAGYTEDWKTEFVVRPLIVNAMELCRAEIVSFLIEYGAKLDVHYEETAPCGPVAFWAYRDDIASDVSVVIAGSADMKLRNELGSTLLHSAIVKNDNVEVKEKCVSIMLQRGANVAARDMGGQTSRDLCFQPGVVGGMKLKQQLDDFILDLSYVGDYDSVEQLILEDYDHILDVRESKRGKNAVELAYLRYYKELLELLDETPRYQTEIRQLHSAVANDDRKGFIRLASEKKVAWGIDRRGRNILHIAVLFQHADMVTSICEQFPQLIYQRDALLRTPVHYAVTLRDQRAILSLISTTNSVDMSVRDANNMSVLDYIEQIERPIPRKLKTRGRREYDYQVNQMVQVEREAIDYSNGQ